MGKPVDDAKELWKNALGGGFKPKNLDVTLGPNIDFIVGHEDIAGVNGVWDGTLQDCETFAHRIGP